MYLNWFLISSSFFIAIGLIYKVLNLRVGPNLLIISFILYLLLFGFKINFFNLSDYKVYFLIILLIVYLPIVVINAEDSLDKELLMSMVLLGSILIVLSENLVVTYLSLELQTFSLFVLISSNRQSIKSSEGGLKYFILGAISSGFFLLSLSMVYFATGGITLDSINSLNVFGSNLIWKYILLLSMFFKLSLFPLHFWIPDVYEASTDDIMCIVGTLPKISVISFIMQLNLFSNFIIWCALGSLVIGTLGAINQSKTKRLLAYSGISHIGLGLLALSTFVKTGVEPTVIYITIYVISFVSIILVLSLYRQKSFTYIYDLSGLSNISIVLSITCSLLLLSIGGLPPLSGFLIKWWIIWTIIVNDYLLVGLLCILFSAVGLVYYLRVTKICYFQKTSSYFIWEGLFKKKYNYMTNRLYLGIGLFVSCFLILNPTLVISLTDILIMSFF